MDTAAWLAIDSAERTRIHESAGLCGPLDLDDISRMIYRSRRLKVEWDLLLQDTTAWPGNGDMFLPPRAGTTSYSYSDVSALAVDVENYPGEELELICGGEGTSSASKTGVGSNTAIIIKGPRFHVFNGDWYAGIRLEWGKAAEDPAVAESDGFTSSEYDMALFEAGSLPQDPLAWVERGHTRGTSVDFSYDGFTMKLFQYDPLAPPFLDDSTGSITATTSGDWWSYGGNWDTGTGTKTGPNEWP